MRRNRFCILLVMVALLAGATAAWAKKDAPSMVGIWEGFASVQHLNGKYIDSAFARFVITGQQGNLFQGYKEWISSATGKRLTESFVGSIETRKVNGVHAVYITEAVDGVLVGDVGGKQLQLHYAEPGKEAKMIFYDLKRIK